MKTETTDRERSALSNVYAALSPILRLASKESPISFSLVRTLLLVAIHEGKTVAELSGMAKNTPSATGRLLADLTLVNKFGGVGLGLVEQRVDDFDQRHMRSYLSEKGRALVRQIVAEMDRRQAREAA